MNVTKSQKREKISDFSKKVETGVTSWLDKLDDKTKQEFEEKSVIVQDKIMNVINDTMLGKVFGYFFE